MADQLEGILEVVQLCCGCVQQKSVVRTLGCNNRHKCMCVCVQVASKYGVCVCVCDVHVLYAYLCVCV